MFKKSSSSSIYFFFLLITLAIFSLATALNDNSKPTYPVFDYPDEECSCDMRDMAQCEMKDCQGARDRMASAARASVNASNIIGKKLRIDDCEQLQIPGLCDHYEAMGNGNDVSGATNSRAD